MSENFDILSSRKQQIPTRNCRKGQVYMRKQHLNMQTLINNNKRDIISNKEEIARIERQIDEKHMSQLQDYKTYK